MKKMLLVFGLLLSAIVASADPMTVEGQVQFTRKSTMGDPLNGLDK